MTRAESYFHYWGKAEKGGPGYHLLVYHCLDVAAVGWILFDPANPLCQRLSNNWKSLPFGCNSGSLFVSAFTISASSPPPFKGSCLLCHRRSCLQTKDALFVYKTP